MGSISAWPKYGYITTDESNPIFDQVLKPGVELKPASRTPPWLVARETGHGAYPINKPQRRFFVKVLSIISDVEQEQFDGQVPKNNGWIRVGSVCIVEELELTEQYGDKGKLVRSIVEKVAEITSEEAEQLVSNRQAEASSLQSWAVDKIRQSSSIKHRHFPNASAAVAEYDILRGVWDRALTLLGEEALSIDPDDLEEELIHPWIELGWTIFDVALAVGAPELFSSKEQDILLSSWLEVFEN